MISKKMEAALNKQINEEFASAYIYLSMAAHFKAENFNGFAHWMEMQYQEEVAHAMKIYEYLNDRGGKVILDAIGAPETSWDSPLAAFEAAYNHEKHITGCIHGLVKLAMEESDFATQSFLQWFVDEQVEEEASVDGIVETLKMVGDHKNGLFMLDRELGRRAPEGGEA